MGYKGFKFNVGNEDLDIHLAAPPDWTFTTGDSVIGTVVRRSRLVTPDASVWIVLKGELVVVEPNASKASPGMGTTDYHIPTSVSQGLNPAGYAGQPLTLAGNAGTGQSHSFTRQLLDPQMQVLFRGPVHINTNEKSDDVWSHPFELKLPWSAWTNGGTQESTNDQPPGYEEGHYSLPRTFRVYGPDSCWTQYYIEAEIRYILGGLPKTHTARLTIQVKPPAPEFEGFGRQKGTVTGMVQSHQLLPGMGQGNLSFKQRRQAFFGSSQVPQLHYEVEVSIPKRIQLNNPEPIPLKFQLVLKNKTSDAVRETPPEVALSSMKMTLVCSTFIKGQETPRDVEIHPYYSRVINSSHKLGLEDTFKKMAASGPMRIPLAEREQPLDVGDLLQLTLHSNGLMAGRAPIRRGVAIVPDMKARCTRHANYLRLDFTITVAGKSEEKQWNGPIEILPS